MKQYKTIDFYGSIILMVAFAIISLIRMDGTFIIGYFVVGAWQVVSMIVHTVNKWFTENRGKRKIYHTIVAVVLVFGFLAVVVKAISMYIMIVMLFAAPVMAIYYTWICYKELFVKMARPLDQLK